MEKNEVLKVAIEKNCKVEWMDASLMEEVNKSIDLLDMLSNSCAKVHMANLIKEIIISKWSGKISDLKVVMKEINLLAAKGAENGKHF